jgi:predicted ATPase
MPTPFVTRVVLRNYRSIAQCSVPLGALTILIGPNGSGKSNFLDGLRFVADALRLSLDHALRDRGGFNEVRHRSAAQPDHFGVRIDFQLERRHGWYAFRIAATPQRGFRVAAEECVVYPTDSSHEPARFRVQDGLGSTTAGVTPAGSPDRLYLVTASGLPEFREVYDGLSRMGFYSLNPDHIRDLQSPDAGMLLARDGSNLASVLGRLSPLAKQRVEEYLGQVVPGVQGVERRTVGPKETLEFWQRAAGAPDPWRCLAANMSDGTLRALGVLVALFQSEDETGTARVPLIGIEEPEIALHPRAAGLLLDSLREASARVQVIVTSHSPDLLDDKDVESDSLLAVVAEDGETRIGPIDRVGRTAMHDHMYTAGELLRLDQMRPDPDVVATPRQTRLFDDE